MKARRITPNYDIVYDDIIKKDTKKIEVPQIIAKKQSQKLVEFIIPLPKEYPAVAINDVKYKIIDVNASILKDKVLIDGVVHCNTSYQTLDGVDSFKYISNKLDTYYGQIRYISVNIPFSCYINIPQINNKDICKIEYATVDEDSHVTTLENGVAMPQYYCKAYHMLKEKVFVLVGVKVLRNIQTFI